MDAGTTQRIPLERSQVALSDFADAEEYLEDAYSARLRLRRIEHGSGPVLVHARTSVGPLTIEDVSLAGDLEAAPDPMNKAVVMWLSRGYVSTECAGLAGSVGAGDVGLLSQPDLPYWSSTHDARATTVLLDPSVLASVASGAPRDHSMPPVRFTSLVPVDHDAARLWKDTVDYVARTIMTDDAVVTPLVIGHASRMLAAVMLSTFPNTASATASTSDRTDTKPVLLRRAIEFMDANATNDIALADIAEAIHVTPRAVQYMFRRHLDTTPLQYLRKMRLHYAHLELSAADRMQDTVTEVAARWGFAHTGRFAVVYRQHYGQSPHTTLRG